MYISRVQLENIRGFGSGDLRVDLDLTRPDGRYAGWTVLAGRNGSGKSSFLRAVALAVAGPFVARGLQQSFVRWIHGNEELALASVDLILDERDVFLSEVERPSSTLSSEMVWRASRSGGEPSLGFPLASHPQIHGALGPVSHLVNESALVGGPWHQNLAAWFIAGYGPYRRLSNSSSDAHRLSEGPLQLSRLANLFRDDVPLTEGIQWLRELHLLNLEGKEGAESMLRGLLNLLNDGLLPEATTVEKVDSEGLWVTQRGASLPLRDMSEGYRTVVALVIDLARQLASSYNEFIPERQDGQWRVLYPGVVLIDEIELHLHLSWQRRIGFWFKRHFPNIQFIVTTHSPFVCQAADPKGLIRLPAPSEDRTAEHVSDELYKTVVNGTVDEAALTELFGLDHVHSDASERLRERVAQLEARVLDGEALPGEREELERLAARLPNTGSALVDRAVRKFGADK
ncbi:AAA family ATPase [Melittangium boletus]|uniref:AAA family ATPase n=1 Tax=Melittangium boletus TaxID=83453 RepID=UPI003DA2E5C1